MISLSLTKMAKKQVNKALNSLTKSIIDDVLQKIEELEISDTDYSKIKKALTTEKLTKRNPPKIPLEKQCSQICKNGSKCTVPICYENTCWAHMLKDKREEYRLKKQTA